jgi:hypothetical protein
MPIVTIGLDLAKRRHRKVVDEGTNTRRQVIGLIPKRWIFSWKILGVEDIRNSCQHQQQNTIAPRFGVVS